MLGAHILTRNNKDTTRPRPIAVKKSFTFSCGVLRKEGLEKPLSSNLHLSLRGFTLWSVRELVEEDRFCWSVSKIYSRAETSAIAFSNRVIRALCHIIQLANADTWRLTFARLSSFCTQKDFMETSLVVHISLLLSGALVG